MAMIISAKLIRSPRKRRRCDDCRTPMQSSHLRLYGYGCEGDPPYVIYIHPECLHPSQLKGDTTEARRLRKALENAKTESPSAKGETDAE
jgi:hypothetical protein